MDNNELYDHTLENCDCDDDNNCGCTYPNNISNYVCDCTPDQNCSCEAETGANKSDNQLAKSE